MILFCRSISNPADDSTRDAVGEREMQGSKGKRTQGLLDRDDKESDSQYFISFIQCVKTQNKIEKGRGTKARGK